MRNNQSIRQCQYMQDFAPSNHRGERRTFWVLLLSFFTMLVEILAGMQFHSMALLADGWHMATHVLAFMIALFAYRYGRAHAEDNTFAFSPAKVSVLGGFASSIALAMVAFAMVGESAQRLIEPQQILFDEAILVAVVGLTVNLLSAVLLRDDHGHHHGHAHHDHVHDHEHHHDHNLRAVYLHVMADALTSLLAIAALLAGKYYGWNWLDSVGGFVGAVVILVWAWGLIKETSPVLLDHGIDEHYLQAIQDTLEQDGNCQVNDIHIWRISPSHHAAIISLTTQQPKSPAYYKDLLANFLHLDHLTVEVNGMIEEASQAIQHQS